MKSMIFSFIIINLLNLSLSIEDIINKIKQFRTGPLDVSKGEGLFKVELGIPNGNKPLAYIDLNNDRKVDIITSYKEYLTNDNSFTETIKMFTYNYDKGLFNEYNYENSISFKNELIEDLIANDINNDNILDFIVVTSNSSKEELKNIYVYLGENNNKNIKFNQYNKFKARSIMILDINGDNTLAILYYNEESKKREVIFYKNKQQSILSFSEFVDIECTEDISFLNTPLLSGQTHSFIDIDGDCLNDIILVSPISEDNQTVEKESIFDFNFSQENVPNKNMEIWRGRLSHNNQHESNSKIKYCLKKNSIIPLVPALNKFTISDINRDGMLDLVFPITSRFPRLLIVYNLLNIESRYDWQSDYCSKHNSEDNPLTAIFRILTNIDNTSSLEIKNDMDNNYKNVVVTIYEEENQIFYNDNLNEYTDSKSVDLSLKGTNNAIIRIGDVNSDSYPDISFVLYNTKTKQSKAYVFLNCYLSVEDIDNVDSIYKRTFLSECDGKSLDLSKTLNNNVDSISYFDLDDNGQLDLLIVKKDYDITNARYNYNLTGYFNNYIYDSFFLKSILTRYKNIYVSNSIGTSYRYIATNLIGTRRMDVSFQNAQIVGYTLSLPFAFIGIGRSNNYIENFHVISSSAGHVSKYNYDIFTPIIPNSQLLISENYKEYDNKLNWNLELIVNPISKLLLLIIVIGAILLILLGAIIYLHRQEVKEDQENDNLHFIQWF